MCKIEQTQCTENYKTINNLFIFDGLGPLACTDSELRAQYNTTQISVSRTGRGPQAGQPNSGPRLEPETSRTQSRSEEIRTLIETNGK
jgi:hypothetical protein